MSESTFSYCAVHKLQLPRMPSGIKELACHMCAKKSRSPCIFVQSDHGFHCPFIESVILYNNIPTSREDSDQTAHTDLGLLCNDTILALHTTRTMTHDVAIKMNLLLYRILNEQIEM